MWARMLALVLVVGGCGVNTGKTFEPVEISGTVTHGDNPVSDVILIFQPTGAGTLPVVIPIKDGKFQTTASPGRYAWFIDETKDGKNLKAFEAIPAEYRAADLDRQIDVTANAELEFVIE